MSRDELAVAALEERAPLGGRPHPDMRDRPRAAAGRSPRSTRRRRACSQQVLYQRDRQRPSYQSGFSVMIGERHSHRPADDRRRDRHRDEPLVLSVIRAGDEREGGPRTGSAAPAARRERACWRKSRIISEQACRSSRRDVAALAGLLAGGRRRSRAQAVAGRTRRGPGARREDRSGAAVGHA